MKTLRICALLALVLFTLPLMPSAASAQEDPDSVRIREMEGQIEAITRELERLSLGREVVEADTSILGLGPGASKVYKVNQGISIGGYGEFLYEGFASEREDGSPSGKSNQLDALRAIIYVGYKFNDRILFNSEIEVEHGSTGQTGSVSLEFAYMDYLFGSGDIGARAGLLLAPMGIVNELHEPPVFLGTKRSVTESKIIPTTWREPGFGLFGGSDNFAWRTYLMTSLDGVGGGSSKAKGFDAGGLRGGRQKGSKAVAEDWGWVGRLDYVGTLGLTLGGSAFYGQTAHNREIDGETVDGALTILEGHLLYKARGWDLTGLLAYSTVGDVSQLNALKSLEGDDSIGEELLGWYVQAGYDVLRSTSTDHELLPYVRYEEVNTQRAVPSGFEIDPSRDLSVLSLGLAWKPIPNAILKADYNLHGTGAETGVNQFNVAMGYLF
jgi:hypothetical protein